MRSSCQANGNYQREGRDIPYTIRCCYNVDDFPIMLADNKAKATVHMLQYVSDKNVLESASRPRVNKNLNNGKARGHLAK